MAAAAGVLRVCSWEDVSYSDAETLLDVCQDSEKLQNHLIRILSRNQKTASRGEKQKDIELDLYSYGVQFCKKQQFTEEQLSAFFTILKSVHEMCISTPYDNLEDTFIFFRELVLRHSVQRPPFSKSLFSIAEVKAITDYILSTYFKHYKMYKYAFTKRVLLSLSLQYNGEPEEEEEVEEEEKEEMEMEERGEEFIGKPSAHAEVKEKEEEREKGEEEEKEKEDSQEQKLKTIINSTLSTHFKQLKVTVEKEVEEHEKRMLEKISQLETLTQQKSKKK